MTEEEAQATQGPKSVFPGLAAAIENGAQTCRDLDVAHRAVLELAAQKTGPGAALQRSELERFAAGLLLAREHIARKMAES